MLDQSHFMALVEEIETLGYDTDTAAHYAASIGDRPVFDEPGNVLVLDDGNKVIARLRLKFFYRR